MEQFLTSSEAAKILDLTPDAVRAIERRGKLKAIRVGRGLRLFKRNDVEELRAYRETKRSAPADK